MIERVRPIAKPPAPEPDRREPRPKLLDNTVVHRTQQCGFCGQWYIKPCDEARKATCQNYLHLTAPKKKAAPRVKPKAKSKKRK